MSKLYGINEVCKLTSVSVRTLHYYDEINLLKPSHRTQKGHRLYSETDLACLQQIVTLKYMGFSLLQIKKYLQDDKFNIFESFKMQAKALAEEVVRIKKVSNLLHYLLNQHELKKVIDWKTVTKIIGILKLKEIDRLQWSEKYLTQTESETFKQFAKKRTQKWIALFNEVKKNINADPDSNIAQRLVKKWHALADAAYGKNPELKTKLWEAYKAGMIPNLPYDKKVIAFLSKSAEVRKK